MNLSSCKLCVFVKTNLRHKTPDANLYIVPYISYGFWDKNKHMYKINNSLDTTNIYSLPRTYAN